MSFDMVILWYHPVCSSTLNLRLSLSGHTAKNPHMLFVQVTKDDYSGESVVSPGKSKQNALMVWGNMQPTHSPCSNRANTPNWIRRKAAFLLLSWQVHYAISHHFHVMPVRWKSGWVINTETPRKPGAIADIHLYCAVFRPTIVV